MKKSKNTNKEILDFINKKLVEIESPLSRQKYFSFLAFAAEHEAKHAAKLVERLLANEARDYCINSKLTETDDE